MKPHIKKAYQDSGLPLLDIPGRDVQKEAEQICTAAREAEEIEALLRANMARLPQLLTPKAQEVLLAIKSLSKREQFALVLAVCEAKIGVAGELLDAYLVKSKALAGESFARLVLESAVCAPDDRHRPVENEDRDWRIYHQMTEAKRQKKKLAPVKERIARQERMTVGAVQAVYQRQRKLVGGGQKPPTPPNDCGEPAAPPNTPSQRWLKACGHRTSLSELDRRLIAAWRAASLDLGIQVDCPFVVAQDRERVRYAVRIHGFGATNGTVLRATPTGELAPRERIPLAIMAEEEGCDFQIVSDLLCEYERNTFIRFLNYSRWCGPAVGRPDWHVGPTTSSK